jgi:hypothetical protein
VQAGADGAGDQQQPAGEQQQMWRAEQCVEACLDAERLVPHHVGDAAEGEHGNADSRPPVADGDVPGCWPAGPAAQRHHRDRGDRQVLIR